MVYQIFLDPPKSPLKRGTLTLVPLLLRGLGGICKCLKSQPKTFQTTSYSDLKNISSEYKNRLINPRGNISSWEG